MPKPWRCMVADDDPLVCETVETFLRQAGGVEYCLKVGDGLTALNLLSAGGFDVLFLDLRMPGLDGESLLKALPKDLPVIVISASEDFGARSYNFGVTDYLVKPLEFPRFHQAWQRALERLTPGAAPAPAPAAISNEIFVKDGSKVRRIDLARLVLIKAEANYVDFILDEGSVMSLITMKRLEEILPAHFIRVHRSYIVNRRRIQGVEDGYVVLGKHKAPIGDSYREGLLRNLSVLN